MNIYLLTHDIWFYTTLLLTVGYITFTVLAYRLLKPFLPILRLSMLGRKHDVAQPFLSPVGQKNIFGDPISQSSLRDKLHGVNN